MPTATMAAATTPADVLHQIARFQVEHDASPTQQELVELLGPTHGLSSMLQSLLARDWLRIETVGDQRCWRIRLPDERRNWVDQFRYVSGLGHYLMQERHFSVSELQSYYEKPYRWHDEFAEWLCFDRAALSKGGEA